MFDNFKRLSLTICLLSSAWLMAQKGTKSPYSVFGIGELKGGQYAYFNALGGAQVATTDSAIVVRSNPASYAGISRNRPIFQIGLNGRFSTLETTNSSAQANYLGLDQFQLGIPIKKNWGASLGLTPYSAAGYLISNPIFEEGDTIAMTVNEGKGTLSNFHVGTAYRQKLSATSRLSLGVNFNYIFGDLERIQSYEHTIFPVGALHSRVVNSTRLGDINFDFGLIYEQELYRSSFSIGATYTPAKSVKSTQDQYAYAYSTSFYQNFNYPFSIIDTAEAIANVAGTTFIPAAFTIGAEYRLRPCPGTSQSYQIIFKGDLKQQKWSEFYTNFNDVRTDSVYKDRTQLAFGIEYSPRANAKLNDNLIPYLAKIRYRFGLNYTMSEIFIDQTELVNYGISFGLGIPVLNGNSNTNLNLGVSYGQFGTTENNLIREQNLGVSFGISISPGVYDRWFVKRKYD